MHGRRDTEGMATGISSDGPGAGRRRPQRPDPDGPLVSCCALHGPGMAEPAQPTASAPAARETPAELGGVCQHGGGHHHHAGKPRRDDGLASMGRRKSRSAETVCPQESAPVVDTPVTTTNVLRLLQRQEYRCAMTGRDLTPQTAALDHIVPIRCGGKHVIENAQVLHKDVNRAKGSLTKEQFVALCREVVTWIDGQSGLS